jgi:site-specific DNA-cytosine methylase
MKKLPVLIINSYAGSLVIAAKAQKHPIIGSYEDAGYGLEIQRANFPNLDYREQMAEWPNQKLNDAMVIAHPPCSCFSQMTPRYMRDQGNYFGVGADKFAATNGVLAYALRNQAMALAVESVPQTLEGARAVHDAVAKKYGYLLFRVLQNAWDLGVPQWRPRFWAIFIREDLNSGDLRLELPVVKHRVLGDILEARLGDHDVAKDRHWDEQRSILNATERGLADKVLLGKFGYGIMARIWQRYWESKGKKVSLEQTRAREFCVCGPFLSNGLRIMDPRKPAPTVLGNSWWMANGRNLSYVEHKRIMGFPDDYVWPGSTLKKHREFLSRGVCPPVAEWVLGTMQNNLSPRPTGAVKLVAGETADLRSARSLRPSKETS